MKNCIICKELKEISEYYKHSQMADGHLNKCKTCTKSQARDRHHELFEKDPEWVESEKARNREKWSRLNYKEKQKIWDEKRPWVKLSIFQNQHRDLKIEKGKHVHHWNYNDAFLRDVFIMNPLDHRRGHVGIVLDEQLRVFRTIEGELLDTKEKHADYLSSKGLQYQNIGECSAIS